jgi:hypothetical protein
VTTAAQPSKHLPDRRSFGSVHPIERLRYVARAGAVDQGELTREAAAALSGLADDPGGLIMSCRRLLARHPTAGALWFLCARMLGSGDARAEAWTATEELEHDPTPSHLARLLPDEARVTVVGYPELTALALPKRGDVEVLAVDAAGDGPQLARRLRGADVEALDVPDAGLAAAVASSQVVVLEASCLGPSGFVAPTGSRAAAAVARHAGVPVWLVVGVGRALPGRFWDAAVAGLGGDEPWEATEEVVPLDLVDRAVGPDGGRPGTDLAGRADCAAVPELLERQ